MSDSRLAVLADFLRSAGETVTGQLRKTQLLGGRSNLTFEVHDGVSAWVFRRPPRSGRTPSAHDMKREWTITSGLQGGPVPVARTVGADLDGELFGYPFTVVAFVEGRVLRGVADLDGLTDTQLHDCTTTLVRTLVDLHEADYPALGLRDFGRPDGFVARQVAIWRRQWELVKPYELRDLDRLTGLLEDRLPASGTSSIVHGDFRLDNTILAADDPAEVRAVVDWELSTLGDPLTDVALMCAYRQPTFDLVLGSPSAWTSPRFPSGDELAETYARLAGVELDDWPFYLALANLKLAVISAGIAHRIELDAADRTTSDPGSGGRAEPAGDVEDLREGTRAFVASGLQVLRGARTGG